MTPTDPRECKYNHDSIFCFHPCFFKHDIYCDGICPDFTPKPRKMEIDDKMKEELHLHTLAMGNSQTPSECKHCAYGLCAIRLNTIGDADDCVNPEYCTDYEPKEKKDKE